MGFGEDSVKSVKVPRSAANGAAECKLGTESKGWGIRRYA
jgi:hypothetical protein